ncbi:MAG: Uma2 family endonuclease, partial [Bacteroidota bacterium]
IKIMAIITDINDLDFSKKYTYADYLNWQFDEMVELIRGKVYRMSPAPNLEHQRLSARLFTLINVFLMKGNCEAFTAPFDVRLPLPPKKAKKNKIDTVVQPDITVVCNPEILDMAGCNGAPDWVIEVLSKSTSKKDLTEKFELYQHAGIPEYWVAHPMDGTLIIFRLDADGKYQSLQPQPFTSGDKISPLAFPKLKIDLTKVFS